MISFDECKKHKSYYIEDLNKNHICSQIIKGKTCDGDSGAVIFSTKTKEIIEILSYKNGVDLHYNDCEANVPTVSTRVSVARKRML